MISLYIYYPLSLVLFEHSVCHEQIFVLINVFMLLAWYLLTTLLVLTLTIHKLRHWPSTTGISPQSHCGDEYDEYDGSIGQQVTPHPRSGDSQGKETFLAPSTDKQTRNYDKKCSNHHPSLSTLRSNGLSHSKMKW